MGTHLWAANMRQRLARAVAGTEFEGLEFHTLRRTVGTLVAHEMSLDAARDLLGHSEPGSVTFRHYVKQRDVTPDVRHVVDAFFSEVDSDITGISPEYALKSKEKRVGP